MVCLIESELQHADRKLLHMCLSVLFKRLVFLLMLRSHPPLQAMIAPHRLPALRTQLSEGTWRISSGISEANAANKFHTVLRGLIVMSQTIYQC